MKIGINASFLRKPGTGIGQVSTCFLRELPLLMQDASVLPLGEPLEFILYVQEPIEGEWPESVSVRAFLPWWKRDDVPRQWLWERELSSRAQADGCDVFLSLYQSATVFNGSLPHVMVVHDIIPKLFPEYLHSLSRRCHWRGIERGIRGADRIIAVSESTRQDLEKHLGIESERISVAYPGLSPVFATVASDSETDETLARYGLERGYIYHGGGLEIRKNARAVLEAYALLRSNHTAATVPPLVISGQIHAKTNPLATDIVGLIEELNLGDTVRLLGRVPEEDLPALYRGARLFVYPSLYEGFGLPLAEAFSQATPVIASRISSLPEVAGDAALLIDPEKSEEIVFSMQRLLNDPSLRVELGERGRAQREKFSYPKFARAIIKQCLSL